MCNERGEVHLRGFAPGQHSSDETWQHDEPLCPIRLARESNPRLSAQIAISLTTAPTGRHQPHHKRNICTWQASGLCSTELGEVRRVADGTGAGRIDDAVVLALEITSCNRPHSAVLIVDLRDFGDIEKTE